METKLSKSLLVVAVFIFSVGAVGPVTLPGSVDRAHASSAEGSPSIKSLLGLISDLKGKLGADGASDLRRLAKKAGRQLRAGKTCAALGTLDNFIDRAQKVANQKARTKLVNRARSLQESILKGLLETDKSPCGIEPPSATVEASVEPTIPSLPPYEDGEPRAVARVENKDGVGADFVADEVVISTTDQAELDAFLERWNGTVLESTGLDGGPTTSLVRIDASEADPSGLTDDLQSLDPMSRGTQLVSSQAALKLLAASTEEAANGLTIGANWIAEGASHTFDDKLAEAPVGDPINSFQYTPNPFDWPYMRKGLDQDINVTGAWRDLEIAGKLSNKIKIAIIDGGFASNGDYPPGATGANGEENAATCGGSECPWHGTDVALVAAGVVDNALGTAGTAGPVADLLMIPNGDASMFANVFAIHDAIEADARIINMSFTMSADMAWSAQFLPLEEATHMAEDEGILVFAAAGNKGIDVDAEDCAGICWEEQWVAPCENDGVICVGGLNSFSKTRHSSSNYGFESCDKAPCQVDIFGPFSAYTGQDPDNMANKARLKSGTSFSSPFVAGVAALIWAADPSQSAFIVRQRLLQLAHKSPDAKVRRYVNAHASVENALPKDNPPLVQITYPQNSATFDYGGFNDIEFKADVVDIEDGSGCCTGIKWSSDVDGEMGTGRKLHYSFDSAGQRLVTLSATDGDGNTSSHTIHLNIENSPPTVKIEKPVDRSVGPVTLYRDVAYSFVGSSNDPNETFQSLPCDSMKWTSNETFNPFNDPSTLPETGCQINVTFNTTGTRTVTLTGEDQHGETATDTIQIEVVEATETIVSILNPTLDEFMDPYVTSQLNGHVTDPNDATQPTYKWTITHNGMTEQIATSLDSSWKPSNYVPFNCGGTEATVTLEATDDGTTSTDSVDVYIGYPAC